MKRLIETLLLLTYLAAPAAAQQKLHLNLNNSCSHDGEDFDKDIYGYPPSAEAQEMVRRICDAVGLQPRFEISVANVPNATATIQSGKRLILYSENFMLKMSRSTGSDWAALGILAHEIGHHLNNDPLEEGESRPEIELQADEFAGRVLALLAASLEQAQACVISTSANGSDTHPPRRARLEAILRGWKRGGGSSAPDADGDKTLDAFDDCPQEFGSTKTKGCPDYDDDGVPNKDDDCIFEPGTAERKGCPLPQVKDADKDGVPDISDKCPNQVGLTRFEGCPDSDGDNVPDNIDMCKTEKGLPMNSGCPELVSWSVALSKIKNGEEPDIKLVKTALDGFNLDLTSPPNAAEAKAILAWIGCTGILSAADGSQYWGKLPVNNYEIRIWLSTYEGDHCYGVRFQTALLKSYIQSNETHFALCKDEGLISCQYCPEMVFVKGGSFQMGGDDGVSYDDEKPIHTVTVNDFYMAKFEVTQKLWKTIMQTNPFNSNACDLCPAINVSWEDTQLFLEKLQEKTRIKFRLPTEAEWEYAANGGNQSHEYRYSGSNSINDVAWNNSNYGGYTHAVGGKKSNELNLFDMSGNAWEWCQDVWHDNYTNAPKDGVAWLFGGKPTQRVIRGGSAQNLDRSCRTSNRDGQEAILKDKLIGFRIVKDK